MKVLKWLSLLVVLGSTTSASAFCCFRRSKAKKSAEDNGFEYVRPFESDVGDRMKRRPSCFRRTCNSRNAERLVLVGAGVALGVVIYKMQDVCGECSDRLESCSSQVGDCAARMDETGKLLRGCAGKVVDCASRMGECTAQVDKLMNTSTKIEGILCRLDPSACK